MDPSASDTRQLCRRMTTEAREAHITAMQFAIALGVTIIGLVVFACALILL